MDQYIHQCEFFCFIRDERTWKQIFDWELSMDSVDSELNDMFIKLDKKYLRVS